jgi:hypothetical protein
MDNEPPEIPALEPQGAGEPEEDQPETGNARLYYVYRQQIVGPDCHLVFLDSVPAINDLAAIATIVGDANGTFIAIAERFHNLRTRELEPGEKALRLLDDLIALRDDPEAAWPPLWETNDDSAAGQRLHALLSASRELVAT